MISKEESRKLVRVVLFLGAVQISLLLLNLLGVTDIKEPWLLLPMWGPVLVLCIMWILVICVIALVEMLEIMCEITSYLAEATQKKFREFVDRWITKLEE